MLNSKSFNLKNPMKLIQYIKPLLTIAIVLLPLCTTAQQILTLEEARKLAVTRNNNLKAAQQNIEAANAQKAVAFTKDKPRLDGSLTGWKLGSPINSVLPEYALSPSVTLSQPIYTGGKIQAGKEMAAKGVEIAEEQKVLTTAEVVLATESAYWQVVLAKEKIKLAEQYARQLQGLHTDLNNAYIAGLTYKNDVLQVKVEQNENELNLTRANDAWVLAKLNLAQITGIEDNIDFDIPDSVLGHFNRESLNRSIDEIVANRPEIKILQKSIEAEMIQEKILKADFKPAIGLNVSAVSALGKEGINLENPTSHSFTSYYGMVQISIPIFDGGQRKQKVKQQQFVIEAQQYQLQETKERISLEVQQAYLQLNESAKHVELSSTSLEQAEENLRLSNDRLKAGTIIGKDVLEAQTIWQQAYTSIIEAKVEYRVNEARLFRALGATRW